MRALVWEAPRRMAMREQAQPQVAGSEVLVKVIYAGICGSELSGYLGHNSLRVPPLVMGHEAAGEVIASTNGTFADGSAARMGVRVTFNPLLTCGTCDRCQRGQSNLCRQRQIIGIHR